MNLYRKIMSIISEPYRIKNGYGLRAVRNERELKALIKFCKNELKEEHIQKYDLKRKWIYEVTIAMYENGNVRDLLFNKEFNSDDFDYLSINEFINNYADWYWS